MTFGMRKEGTKAIVQIQSYEDAPFLGLKYPSSKNIFSENPLINFFLFIHVYIHSRNQSQISIR